jgi:hypothetical protein
MKKRMIVVSSIIALLSLTACLGKVNPDKYKDDVNSFLESNYDEAFTCTGSEVVDSDKEQYRYYYSTTDRDLDFEVVTYETDDNKIACSTTYYDAISKLYQEDIENTISECNLDYNSSTKKLVVRDYDKVASALAACNAIYSVENQYHSGGIYTEAHSALDIALYKPDSEECIFTYSINGTDTEEDILYYIDLMFNASEGNE